MGAGAVSLIRVYGVLALIHNLTLDWLHTVFVKQTHQPQNEVYIPPHKRTAAAQAVAAENASTPAPVPAQPASPAPLGVHVPLMSVIVYRGHRLTALSVIPIDSKSLIYGACIVGASVCITFVCCDIFLVFSMFQICSEVWLSLL